MDRIPVPVKLEAKSGGQSDKKIHNQTYRDAKRLLEAGNSERVNRGLRYAQNRPAEIECTRKQWALFETIPREIVDSWELELWAIPIHIKAINSAIIKRGGNHDQRII